MLKMLSLCSGIGGGDLAAQWTQGIEIVAQVERDPFCLAVLHKHWPHIPKVSDLHDVRGDEFGPLDLILAGLPCQPHSYAGRRHSTDDERDLWPAAKRICATARPRWLVVENVPGILTSHAPHEASGAFFERIVTDLATMGYRTGWCVYGAGEVGAPHRRERVFLIAHLADSRSNRRRDRSRKSLDESWCNAEADPGEDGQRRTVAHAHSQRRTQQSAQADTRHDAATDGHDFPLAHPNSERLQEWHQHGDQSRPCPAAQHGSARTPQSGLGGMLARLPARMDSHQQRSGDTEETPPRQSWQGWPARPCEASHPWEPPRTVLEPVLRRRSRIKALGNAIVPQQLYPLLMAIVEEEARAEENHHV